MTRERTVDGLAVIEWGPPDGQLLVLVHGAFASAAYWEPLVELLPTTWRVVAYDLRGHGRSSTGGLGLADDVADLRAVIATCGDRTPVVAGISYGTLVVASAAVSAPSVAGVALLEGPLRDTPAASSPTPAAVSESMRSQGRPWRGSESELAERLAAAASLGVAEAAERRRYARCADGTWEQRPDLERSVGLVISSRTPVMWAIDDLSAPTLCLVGTRSSLLAASAAERQQAAADFTAAHPSIQVEYVDAGHDLVTENPEATARALAAWLGRNELTGTWR